MDETPIWNDLFLRFPDEATATSALEQLSASVDVIGTIYEPLGALIDGEDPAPVALPGWHVNVRLRVDEPTPVGLVQYLVTPTSPVRGWL